MATPENTQTTAQKAVFGDSTVGPWDRLQAAQSARREQTAAADLSRANAQQQASAFADANKSKGQWASLMAALAGRRKKKNPLADALGQVPNMGQ